MSITNWSTPDYHEQLLNYINAKHQLNKAHIYTRVEPESFINNSDIRDVIKNQGYFMEPDITYQYYIAMESSISRAVLPIWKEDIKNHMTRIGATYHSLLSTALSSRYTLTLVFELDGVYYTIASASPDDPRVMYKYTLATMLLDCKDNKDLVLRITDAIQNSDDLVFVEEELTMISNYNKQKALNGVIDLCMSSMNAEFSNDKLDEIQRTITKHTRHILTLEKELREIQLKQFALTTLGVLDESIRDLKEYLKDISEDILDVYVKARSNHSNTLRITMKSYMYIPESDSDFFKPEAIESPNHILYNYRRAAKIMKAVMDQEIRIPITASYQLITEQNTIEHLDGYDGIVTNNRDPATINYIVNAHIDRYSCFTGYKRMMSKAFNESNYVAFFETMRQCTASINVFDSTVMNYMVLSIEQYGGPILIKTEDGWKNINVEEYLNENAQTE